MCSLMGFPVMPIWPVPGSHFEKPDLEHKGLTVHRTHSQPVLSDPSEEPKGAWEVIVNGSMLS